VKIAAALVFATGNILVISSMWALGITGTYLGDYFGILMEDRVTSFPFNVTNNPMYYGSALSFVGTALWFAKPAGLFLSGFVLLMYLIALQFEE
jgi:phosphatidylethanolamine N-methyltransferase